MLQEIWGSDPRALLCSSYAPTGRLERVDGGFRLSGRWSRCTGAHHASWLSVAALRVGPDGAAQDFMAVLVPRADYTVEPTWNGLGLRGIGADDVVVSGAFVPEHRAFSWLDLDAGPPPCPRCTGFRNRRCTRWPEPYRCSVRRNACWRRGVDGSGGRAEPLAIGPHRHRAVRAPDPPQRRRSDGLCSRGRLSGCRVDAAHAPRPGDGLRACRAGASSTIVRDPRPDVDERLLERVWRDVQTARMHVASNVEQVLSVAGRFALGLDVDDLIW